MPKFRVGDLVTRRCGYDGIKRVAKVLRSYSDDAWLVSCAPCDETKIFPYEVYDETELIRIDQTPAQNVQEITHAQSGRNKHS
jgi:hypothetical protein